MNNNTSTHSNITSTAVPEEKRLSTIETLFGMYFPLAIEPFIYNIAQHISLGYTGGYWHYYTLSNGGFYMHPECGQSYHAICENGFTGDIDAETLGISACLYSYSHLSFSDNKQQSELCTRHYHLLRDFVPELSQVDEILAMTD